MPRPLHAVVSVSALAANLHRARAAAPGCRVWAVVKANGYGHGLDAVLSGFAQADGLALLEFEAAERLRVSGWKRPLLMLEGPFEAADVETAVRLGLSLVVHQPDQLAWLRSASGPLDLYLKFNSGMSRLGLRQTPFREARTQLDRIAAVRSVTLMTHFANADRSGGAYEALAAFEHACQGLPGPRCAANSAAVLAVPGSHGDWVRPGIMLYGATPFTDRDARSLGLRAAMGLRSSLLAVQSLAPGDAVGYGATFVAPRPMRIGVVACGYADGYPRHAPTGTPVLVDGVRTHIVGRVAMDMLTVDLTPVPLAGPGAPVELWGETLAVDEVAAAAGTLGYELLCAIAPRVPLAVMP
jgi:alanine racemase